MGISALSLQNLSLSNFTEASPQSGIKGAGGVEEAVEKGENFLQNTLNSSEKYSIQHSIFYVVKKTSKHLALERSLGKDEKKEARLQ